MHDSPNLHPQSFHCPSCKSSDVRRSRRRGIDILLSSLNVYPYRCRQYNCERRFYRFGHHTDSEDRNQTGYGVSPVADRPEIISSDRIPSDC